MHGDQRQSGARVSGRRHGQLAAGPRAGWWGQLSDLDRGDACGATGRAEAGSERAGGDRGGSTGAQRASATDLRRTGVPRAAARGAQSVCAGAGAAREGGGRLGAVCGREAQRLGSQCGAVKAVRTDEAWLGKAAGAAQCSRHTDRQRGAKLISGNSCRVQLAAGKARRPRGALGAGGCVGRRTMVWVCLPAAAAAADLRSVGAARRFGRGCNCRLGDGPFATSTAARNPVGCGADDRSSLAEAGLSAARAAAAWRVRAHRRSIAVVSIRRRAAGADSAWARLPAAGASASARPKGLHRGA